MKEFERKFYITTLWSIALEIFMAPTYDLYLILIVGKKHVRIPVGIPGMILEGNS